MWPSRIMRCMRKYNLGSHLIFSTFLMLGLTLISSVAVFAESTEADRGRLPDGRAFRTDQEGNQLVDYIAELELAKEGLEGRVFRLQDQVRERDSQLGKVQVKSEPVMCPRLECPVTSCPPVFCPRVEQAVLNCPTCETEQQEVLALNKKITRIMTENSEIETEKSSVVEELGTCQAQSSQFESTSVSLKDSLDDLRKALADRDGSLQVARAQVSQLRQEQQRFVALRAEGNSDSRASLSSATATSSTLSNSALAAAKAQLVARLSEIKSQARARDEQFLRIDQRGKSLQVRPAALKTRSGFELKVADDAIKNAVGFRSLSDVSRELDTLSRIVSDDIRLGAKLASGRR